ncbi:MAG: glycosyltransferase [Rhodobacteraceae bacterium]|nr:glycosyltransferase [Paracoccaceae bacterium]
MAPHVTILLGSFNGARHLPAQLASIAAQRGCDWSLRVSDDASTDGTRDVVSAFAAAHPERDIRLRDGPGRGAAANYFGLLCDPDLPPGAVALADQDDLWLGGKLARALRRIGSAGSGPVLYGAEAFLAGETGKPYRRSAAHIAPSLENAAVQNLFGGHSIVLNADALALVRQAGPQDVPFHDWWLYLFLTAAGARLMLDPLPVALYRQHGGNLVGAPGGALAGLRRAGRVFGSDYGRWIAANLDALERVGPLLTPQAREFLVRYRQSTQKRGPFRAAALRRLGLRRDTALATAVYLVAAAVGRA